MWHAENKYAAPPNVPINFYKRSTGLLPELHEWNTSRWIYSPAIKLMQLVWKKRRFGLIVYNCIEHTIRAINASRAFSVSILRPADVIYFLLSSVSSASRSTRDPWAWSLVCKLCTASVISIKYVEGSKEVITTGKCGKLRVTPSRKVTMPRTGFTRRRAVRATFRCNSTLFPLPMENNIKSQKNEWKENKMKASVTTITTIKQYKL